VINYNDIPLKKNHGEKDLNNDADDSIEGINLRSLFSLAKQDEEINQSKVGQKRTTPSNSCLDLVN